MNNIIEKIGSYQIMTNLLPGALLGIILKSFFCLPLLTTSTGEEILIYYFLGLTVNRIGSLLIKPILEKIKFIRKVSYPEYMKAEKTDDKLSVLSETNNFFRTILACFILIPIIGLTRAIVVNTGLPNRVCQWILLFLLSILFLFSYRKQTFFVTERTETINKQKET